MRKAGFTKRSRRREEAEGLAIQKNPPRYLGGYHARAHGEGETVLRHSQELFFRERMPWRLGLVRLAEGVSLVVHLDARCGPAPSAVTVEAVLDRAGQAALVAKPAGIRLGYFLIT